MNYNSLLSETESLEVLKVNLVVSLLDTDHSYFSNILDYGQLRYKLVCYRNLVDKSHFFI